MAQNARQLPDRVTASGLAIVAYGAPRHGLHHARYDTRRRRHHPQVYVIDHQHAGMDAAVRGRRSSTPWLYPRLTYVGADMS